MLEIPDMSEKESLFNFMDGLQMWAQQELQRRGVQDLAAAMAAAEQLFEFKRSDPSKAKNQKNGQGKGGGEREKNSTPKEGGSKQSSGKGDKDPRARKDGRNTLKRKLECVICKGPGTRLS